FTIGPVRFHVTDPLFDPSLVGKQEILSLSDAIHLAITSCEPDRRQLLFENIVVTGGISLIKGLKERILKELHRFLSITENAGEFQTRECKCLKIPEYFTAYKDRPDLAGFLGAAIVAKLVFPEPKNFITKIDYNENGPSVVHVKSY
ncbi:4286_t:CDS:2, partial [Paraglomus occultum]